MLQWGKNITQAGDPLHPITVEEMHRRISRPKPVIQDQINQLRAVRALDEQRYRELKKMLPYFVCGVFHPPLRRGEHFAAIEHFLIDLDHLAAADLHAAPLRERLCELPIVEMAFVSPGGDGLKLMFRLSEPCRDRALFSAFYKVFARRFAEQHQLLPVVDLATSDVTRACFISADPDAFHRADATPLVLEDYLPGLDFDQAERLVREAERSLAAARPAPPPPPPELESELLLKIRQKLNPSARLARPKDYYLPPETEEAIPLIREKLAACDLQLEAVEPINYGRRLRIRAGLLWAEVNIFHGKRGFSVVKTAKSGSHAELADLAARAVAEVLLPEHPPPAPEHPPPGGSV